MQQIYRRAPMSKCDFNKIAIPKCDFNKVARQLYWNHVLTWVLPCKFAAYFRNIFSLKHLLVAASKRQDKERIYALILYSKCLSNLR